MVRSSRWLLVSGFVAHLAAGSASAADTDRSAAALAAVRTFADNVLALGRDKYGPVQTPLFVDGLNIDTHEPAKWKLDGKEWILSNQASQQYLFRTLVALSRLTGEPRYKAAAVEAIRYQFEHLSSSTGLLRWGGHCAYDAGTETLVGELHGKRLEHELKRHYPYFELMWEVDPAATTRYIEAFWDAHIIDWATLCMNRHGRFDHPLDRLWAHEYKGGPVFFPCEGLTFVSTGSDLYYAAAMLSHLSGKKEPLVWAKRMAHRYVETRNPTTGLPGYQYTQYASGDRAKEQFGPEWGDRILEGTLLAPEQSARQFGDSSVSELMLGEILGDAGKDFAQWGLDDLAAYARYAYNDKDNTFSALITDGTRLTGSDVKRKGYFGPVGSPELQPIKARPDLLRAYAIAFRVSGRRPFWDTARSIARGNDLGDIGETPDAAPAVNLQTSCAEPLALLAILEIQSKRPMPAYLDLARRIADNIVKDRFQKGFFVGGKDRLFAKFDTMEPLALLQLVAVERGQPQLMPRIPPGKSYFHCKFDGLGRTYDNSAIYSQLR